MGFNERSFGETYTILREIGSGGGGTVYLAYHQRLKKEVALKKIHNNLTDINTRMETDILKNVRHSYLPQVIDFLEEPDGVYTVMDYIDGVSLAQVLQKNPWVPEKEVIKWFKQICQALEVLHHQPKPVLHGDIKPANVMLQRSGDICLIDFNIASIYEGSKTIISGYTPGYAAPEQIEFLHRNIYKRDDFGQSGVTMMENASPSTVLNAATDATSRIKEYNELQTIIDVRTDIYNLGATIFHLLTGQKPVSSEKTYTAVEELNPNISATLCHIVNKCIAPDSRERYQDVSEVLHALENMYKSDERYIKLIRGQRIKRTLYIIGTIAFSAMAAFGGVLMMKDNSAEYTRQINIMIRAAEERNEKALEKAFDKAKSIDRSNAEAYVIYARYFYETYNYEECLNLIENAVDNEVDDEQGQSDLYYVASSCYMAEEDYDSAVKSIKTAIELNPDNAVLYSDYAVCEAKRGDVDEARKQLNKAKKKGIKSEGLSYTNGEIYKADNNYKEAEKCFNEALKSTKDTQIKVRCYMALIEMAVEQNSEVSLLKGLQVCDAALDNKELNDNIAILENKAQILVDLGKLTKNKDYYDQAITVFSRLKEEKAISSLNTYLSLANLYEEVGEYDKEEALLREMLRKFGEDYRIYMSLAYMEGKKQETLGSAEKDYSAFESYAKEAYNLYKKAGASDVQMEQLKHICEQANIDIERD